MKQIPLNNGLYALVDDDDFETLSNFKWIAEKRRKGFYAHAWDKKIKKIVRMHRLIMGNPGGYMVDHKNHDGLDNRRSNLRLCNNQQNHRNMPVREGKRYKGISFDKNRNKWAARIRIGDKRINIGRYDTALEAALAYNEHALKHFGEFACLNRI